MKTWTILALLVAICAVFLGVGRTEETPEFEDFEEQPYEDVDNDNENEDQLADSFMDPKNDDTDDDEPKELDESSLTQTDQDLENANESPASNEEDEPEMFKRAPWRRRRRRIRIRIRFRKLIRRLKKIHGHLKKGCKWVLSRTNHRFPVKVCKVINKLGDEGRPRLTNEEIIVPNDEAVVPDKERDEVQEENWLHEV